MQDHVIYKATPGLATAPAIRTKGCELVSLRLDLLGVPSRHVGLEFLEGYKVLRKALALLRHILPDALQGFGVRPSPGRQRHRGLPSGMAVRQHAQSASTTAWTLLCAIQ